MTRILLLFLSVLPACVFSQYRTRIIVSASPTSLPVFMAGSFNNWNPGDGKWQLTKNNDGTFIIELNALSAGNYEFKFTQGSWSSVETTSDGHDVSNRSISLTSDTTLYFTVAAWKKAASAMKSHTASKNVQVIDTSFNIPQLGRTRRIWVYLPPGYASSSKKYPVLYMHDGQNLFDEATSFAGEWGVDETLDSLTNACIVVGIDNGGNKRMNEYNPNDTKDYGKGEGREYLAFIVETLKPYIDKKYRTQKDKQHTWMAGSSMGGLISFYAGLYYPDIFGGLGVFSPSFWIVPDLHEQIDEQQKKAAHAKQSYYFYAGAQESKQMVPDMQSVALQLKEQARPDIKIDINPDGKHNELTWKKIFPAFYQWLVSNK